LKTRPRGFFFLWREGSKARSQQSENAPDDNFRSAPERFFLREGLQRKARSGRRRASGAGCEDLERKARPEPARPVFLVLNNLKNYYIVVFEL
jgi:hypothetical protein